MEMTAFNRIFSFGHHSNRCFLVDTTRPKCGGRHLGRGVEVHGWQDSGQVVNPQRCQSHRHRRDRRRVVEGRAVPRGWRDHAEPGDAFAFGDGAHDRGAPSGGQAKPNLQHRLRLTCWEMIAVVRPPATNPPDKVRHTDKKAWLASTFIDRAFRIDTTPVWQTSLHDESHD